MENFQETNVITISVEDLIEKKVLLENLRFQLMTKKGIKYGLSTVVSMKLAGTIKNFVHCAHNHITGSLHFNFTIHTHYKLKFYSMIKTFIRFK